MIRRLMKWLVDGGETVQTAARITPITNRPDLERALQLPVAVLYKHSPLCGVSSWARRQVLRFASKHPDAEVFQIDVIRSPDVSDAVEELLGVRHQSPQAFLVRRGAPAWTGSHGSITADTLERELGPIHELG